MKAWIDQVVRADRTFRFTPTGVEGLTNIERAWVVTASASTTIDSPIGTIKRRLHVARQRLAKHVEEFAAV